MLYRRRGDVGDPVADAGEEHRDGVRARRVAQEGDRGGGGGAEQAQEGGARAVAVRAGQVLQRVGPCGTATQRRGVVRARGVY